MNENVKQLWVNALESGEYEQAQGKLRDASEDTYCCLGVLCDLFLQETGEGEWNDGVFVAAGESGGGVLPERVRHWAGVDEQNPVVTFSADDAARLGVSYSADKHIYGIVGETLRVVISLAEINDMCDDGSGRNDFSTIARVVREML